MVNNEVKMKTQMETQKSRIDDCDMQEMQVR